MKYKIVMVITVIVVMLVLTGCEKSETKELKDTNCEYSEKENVKRTDLVGKKYRIDKGEDGTMEIVFKDEYILNVIVYTYNAPTVPITIPASYVIEDNYILKIVDPYNELDNEIKVFTVEVNKDLSTLTLYSHEIKLVLDLVK